MKYAIQVDKEELEFLRDLLEEYVDGTFIDDTSSQAERIRYGQANKLFNATMHALLHITLRERQGR